MPIKPSAAPAPTVPAPAPPTANPVVQVVNSVDPASPSVVASQTPVVATLGPPEGGVSTSVTEAGVTTVVQPGAATLPVVEGLAMVNHGADAHFEVTHGYCGKHRQGSLIKLSDLPSAANILQLIKLGALKVLPAFLRVAEPAVVVELTALGLNSAELALAETVVAQIIPAAVTEAINPKAGATPLTSGGQA